MWVCVSHPFNLTMVAKAIIREATKKDTNTSTWDNALHAELCGSVEGKKFLLVLDDVWTEDPKDWDPLKHLLSLGAEGSRILVTTRSESVASRINSCKHRLQVLSNGDSSSLLCRKAFQGKEHEKNERFEDLSLKISRKCNGLPLALSLLGSLLNKTVNEDHWSRVLESKIWELNGFHHQEKLLNPSLLLCYDSLSAPLKNCFSYCAIFLKDHKLKKRSLVRLWMAQGFLDSADKTKSPELIGEEYFDELAARSFFLEFSVSAYSGEVYCKMHDLIHDFAQYLTKNHCYTSYNNDDTFCSDQNTDPIHLSLIYDTRDGGPSSFHSSIEKVDNVRTVQCIRHDNHSFYVDNLSPGLIQHLRYLRVLKMKKMGIKHLSSEIDKLIHLSKLKSLPHHLPCLSQLYIKSCKPDDHHPYLPVSPNLTRLDITEYGHTLHHLGKIAQYKELESLKICANIDGSFKCFPEYVQNLAKLQDLDINNFGEVCRVGDWSILSHIPSIKINGRTIDLLTYSLTSSLNPVSV
ncbi:hypothetical protein MKX03_031520 [Papaver bracteatum]|nr:hypothetical protein MKX03_031520 [Papaver bracteatum]